MYQHPTSELQWPENTQIEKQGRRPTNLILQFLGELELSDPGQYWSSILWASLHADHLLRLQLYALYNSHASRFKSILFLSWNEKSLSTLGLWAVLTERSVVVMGKAKCVDWPRARLESHICSYAVVQTDSLCTCANCTLVQTDW